MFQQNHIFGINMYIQTEIALAQFMYYRLNVINLS